MALRLKNSALRSVVSIKAMKRFQGESYESSYSTLHCQSIDCNKRFDRVVHVSKGRHIESGLVEDCPRRTGLSTERAWKELFVGLRSKFVEGKGRKSETGLNLRSFNANCSLKQWLWIDDDERFIL